MGCNCKSKPTSGGKPQIRTIARPNSPSSNGSKRIIKREIK